MSKHEEVVLFLLTDFWSEIEGLPEGSPKTFKGIVPLPENRTQLVFFKVNDVAFQLSSPFAQTADFSAERAFKVNPTLFGLDIVFDRYSLVMAGLVEDFSAESITQALVAIAVAADLIENQIGGGDEL